MTTDTIETPATAESAEKPKTYNKAIIAIALVATVILLNLILTGASAPAANGKRFSFLPKPTTKYVSDNLACGDQNFKNPTAADTKEGWRKEGMFWHWHFSQGIRYQSCNDK